MVIEALEASFEPCLGQPGYDVSQTFELKLMIEADAQSRVSELTTYLEPVSNYLEQASDLGLAWLSSLRPLGVEHAQSDPYDDAPLIGCTIEIETLYFTPHLGAPS